MINLRKKSWNKRERWWISRGTISDICLTNQTVTEIYHIKWQKLQLFLSLKIWDGDMHIGHCLSPHFGYTNTRFQRKAKPTQLVCSTYGAQLKALYLTWCNVGFNFTFMVPCIVLTCVCYWPTRCHYTYFFIYSLHVSDHPSPSSGL
jgi:hypothetical protein